MDNPLDVTMTNLFKLQTILEKLNKIYAIEEFRFHK
jgi:hypothetical protein